MIIISGHASFINGKIFEAPVNTLAETLIAEKKDFIHIRHSIDGSLKSKVYFYKKGILASEEKLPVLQRVSILRYLSEIVATFIFLCRLKSQSKIYIGADPLNAFSGVLARKADGIQKSVFFTADYSEKRFGNPALNFFYQSLDRFCIRKADFVWNVSSRIYNLRAKMGVGKRNKLVPNIPSDEYKKYLKNQKNKFHLITMGILGDQFDFNNLFLALKELISTDKEIVLDIVGDGPKKEAFVKAVSELGIANNVKFWGYVDHSIALELVSKSGIGLALYNGNWSFNYFGDSMNSSLLGCR